MNTLGVCFITSSLLVSTLGFLVFIKRGQSRERLVFSWFCFSIFGWLFCYGMMQSHFLTPLFWARLGHSSVIFVPITYLHFVFYFLKLPKIRLWLRFYYSIGAVSFIMMHLTNWYIPSLKAHTWGLYPVGGPMMWFDFLLLVSCAMYCWVMFIVRCREAHRAGLTDDYNRLKYGSIAMTILSFSLYDFLPKLINVEFYPFGFGTTTIFVLICTYAILKQHLMDLNIAIRKTVIYSILAALITAIYLSAVVVMEKWFQGFFGYRSVVATAVVGFAVAMGFVPLKSYVQRLVDRHFFRKSHEELIEENEQLRKQVERTEKLKAVATLAAGMAHEIKNPLTSIKTFAEYLPEKYDDPAFREKFAKIMGQEVDKMNELIHRLLEFAKPSPPQLELVEVSNTIKETLDFIQGTLVNRQVQVETNFTEPDQVTADKAQLKQVFLNLLLNSVEAMNGPGCIRISTARENGHLQVNVSDTGPGIAPKDLQHVFDPFYTTKPSGTGLGLSVVHSIIRQHGGRVNIHSHVGEGTTVCIDLPLNGGVNGKSAHLNS